MSDFPNIFNRVRPLNTFIQLHGCISNEVKKYRKRDLGLYRMIIFEDGTHAYTAHHLDSLSIIELNSNSNILKIGDFKKGGYCLFRAWVDPTEWKKVDLESTIKESYVQSRCGNINDIKKQIVICKELELNHKVYDRNCTLSIIWEDMDKNVRVYGKDGEDNYALLKFNNVLKWYQVTQKIGNTTVLWPFYVLQIQDYYIILNLKTLCFNLFLSDKIIPTDMTFHREFCYNLKEKTCLCDYGEHFWADNILYDAYLREKVSLKEKICQNSKLFDIYGRFIAVGNGSYINMYQIMGKELKEVQYKCKENTSSGRVLLFIYGYCCCPFFDPISKKFIIDVENIRKAYWEQVKRQGESSYDPWDDYDLINDGLDGEAEAYWGLLD